MSESPFQAACTAFKAEWSLWKLHHFQAGCSETGFEDIASFIRKPVSEIDPKLGEQVAKEDCTISGPYPLGQARSLFAEMRLKACMAAALRAFAEVEPTASMILVGQKAQDKEAITLRGSTTCVFRAYVLDAISQKDT